MILGFRYSALPSIPASAPFSTPSPPFLLSDGFSFAYFGYGLNSIFASPPPPPPPPRARTRVREQRLVIEFRYPQQTSDCTFEALEVTVLLSAYSYRVGNSWKTGHREELRVLTFRALALRLSEYLHGGQFIFRKPNIHNSMLALWKGNELLCFKLKIGKT